MAKEYVYSNQTTSKNAQCKIVVYQWVNGLADPNATEDVLAKSTRLDISSQLTSAHFGKSLGNPSGNFSFTLTNSPGIGSQDWKDIIRRGFWCLIYMSNDKSLHIKNKVGSFKPLKSEAKYIRGICYIERANVKATTGASGDIDYTFEVSGRDFGVIYEETTIWQNLFKYDKITTDSIKTSLLPVTGNKRVHEAMEIIHNLFYFPSNLPGAKVNDDKSFLEIGLQWLLPKEMLIDLGFSLSDLSRGTYWGALDVLDISKTQCGISIENPSDFLSGNAWSQLKKLSIPQLHELFCETDDDGKPSMTFRPIPWAINKDKYPTVGQFVDYYKDLEFLSVPAVDLIDFDLSEDDHNRYNSFLATISSGLINVNDNISLLQGSDYVKHNKASIKRHGFRPMHVTVDSIVKNEEQANGSANRRDLIEFNELLYDYWNNAIFAESGSMVKIGSNDVKIGKCLKFNNDVPYLVGRRYYVEGYSDVYTVDENGSGSWTQEIALTRGFEERDLNAKGGFTQRNVPFSKPGEYTPGGTNGDD